MYARMHTNTHTHTHTHSSTSSLLVYYHPAPAGSDLLGWVVLQLRAPLAQVRKYVYVHCSMWLCVCVRASRKVGLHLAAVPAGLIGFPMVQSSLFSSYAGV